MNLQKRNDFCLKKKTAKRSFLFLFLLCMGQAIPLDSIITHQLWDCIWIKSFVPLILLAFSPLLKFIKRMTMPHTAKRVLWSQKRVRAKLAHERYWVNRPYVPPCSFYFFIFLASFHLLFPLICSFSYSICNVTSNYLPIQSLSICLYLLYISYFVITNLFSFSQRNYRKVKEKSKERNLLTKVILV